jgi:hypothetical protein
VKQAIPDLEIAYPIALDNPIEIWNAYRLQKSMSDLPEVNPWMTS